jgi:hypothetical protein
MATAYGKMYEGIAADLASLRDDIRAAKAKLAGGLEITAADLDELDGTVLLIAADVSKLSVAPDDQTPAPT